MLDIMKRRTSTRTFLEKEIPTDLIYKIIEGGMCAPTAGNQQECQFYIIKDQSIIELLSQAHQYARCIQFAKTVIVVCYQKETKYPEYHHIDSAMASQNILLGLESYDLGGVFIGIAPIKERMAYVKDVLKLDDTVDVFGIIPCGYPKQKSVRERNIDHNKIHII